MHWSDACVLKHDCVRMHVLETLSVDVLGSGVLVLIALHTVFGDRVCAHTAEVLKACIHLQHVNSTSSKQRDKLLQQS